MSNPHYPDYANNQFVASRHHEIASVLGCFDRLIIKGALNDIGYDRAMENHLNRIGVAFKDCQHWASANRDEIRDNAERLASEAGLEIEPVHNAKSFRKEQRVKEAVVERGDHPGSVPAFPAMEPFQPFLWHYDRQARQTH